MATTTATVGITSADLTPGMALGISATTTLNKTGLTDGLEIMDMGYGTLTVAEEHKALHLALGTADTSNYVYLANESTNAEHYIEVVLHDTVIGRLYAGDWMFTPWSAVSGTKQVFTVTFASTWVAGETWTFDGITMTAANSTTADIAAQIAGLNYPNWTTDHANTESTVTFEQRWAGGLTQSEAVTADGTLNTAGNGTAAITLAAGGTKSQADISIRPSVHTEMTYETMLIHQ